MTVLQAIDDPNLFGPWFSNRTTWSTWKVFLKALFGLRLKPNEVAVFERITGRASPPRQQAQEAWLVIGRREAKASSPL